MALWRCSKVGVGFKPLGGNVISADRVVRALGKSTLLRCCNLLEDSQQGDFALLRRGGDMEKGTGHNRRPPGFPSTVLRIRYEPVDMCCFSSSTLGPYDGFCKT